MGQAKDITGTGEGQDERHLVLISGVDSRRREVHVLKRVEDGIEAAVLRPVEHGETLNGDLVRLHPRKEFPLVAELETVLRHPDRARDPVRTGKGPAMVATEAYRRGWDAVFGTRPCAPQNPDAN